MLIFVKRHNSLKWILLYSLVLLRCTVSPETNLKELTRLQQQEQQAHMRKDVLLLVEMFHDTLCQVQNGRVSYFTKQEMSNRFAMYFDAVEFIRWEDNYPPKIQLSTDGSMAHITVQKGVELVVKADSSIQKTDFAWTELWRKGNQGWKLYSISSTEVSKP